METLCAWGNHQNRGILYTSERQSEVPTIGPRLALIALAIDVLHFCVLLESGRNLFLHCRSMQTVFSCPDCSSEPSSGGIASFLSTFGSGICHYSSEPCYFGNCSTTPLCTIKLKHFMVVVIHHVFSTHAPEVPFQALGAESLPALGLTLAVSEHTAHFVMESQEAW